MKQQQEAEIARKKLGIDTQMQVCVPLPFRQLLASIRNCATVPGHSADWAGVAGRSREASRANVAASIATISCVP